jgi:outer membrane protein OmpA-like peptidoglycan-associated protein
MQKTFFMLFFVTLIAPTLFFSQEVTTRPEWWFGGGAGINVNGYSGEIKTLNSSITPTPLATAFTKGSGSGLQLGILAEYRPSLMWGVNLTLGLDSRSGKFDDAGGQSLSTSLNYLSLDPNLRLSPFESGFHLFAGPRFGFNVSKSFDYTPQGGGTSTGDWSETRGLNIGGQIGAGYDIPLTETDAATQVELAPRLSVHFGQGIRSVEDWTVTTVRLGLDVKFATTALSLQRAETAVNFLVRSPMIVPQERRVKETFPVRNYIFFDQGSTELPQRYVQLTPGEAAGFKEEHLLDLKERLTGRSTRQLQVYYNTINVIGDRLRRYPQATIMLIGSSDRGAEEGRSMAESIKSYLTNVFGIAEQRITAVGRTRPEIPSYQPGGTRDVELVKAEDRRVDITSGTIELLLPVQIISLQEDPLDADVVLTVPDAREHLASWSVEAIDQKGMSRNFGPFRENQERINGNAILGDASQGEYRLRLIAQAKDGGTITKEEKIRLARAEGPEEQMGLRFSILFEFDQSKTVATYEKFLRETVVPTISDGAAVIIHGHTDIVGEEGHNLELSRNRATETMNVIQRELNRLGKRRVKFDTFGFGEDPRRAPFENRLPEERFYNRTVIIDIVPE